MLHVLVKYRGESLPNSNVKCIFFSGLGAATLSQGVNLNDNQWHSVVVRRYGRFVTLSVDGADNTESKATHRLRHRYPNKIEVVMD